MESIQLGQEKTPVNGVFWNQVEAGAAETSQLSESFREVTAQYITNGDLAYALEYIQSLGGRIVLSDSFENLALVDMADSEEPSGFNDTTSNGGPRKREEYLEKDPSGLNPDPLFRGMRPRGFEIGEDQQPVLAVVALDPTRMGNLDDDKRAILLEEVQRLRVDATDDDESVRSAAVGNMTQELKDVLSSCLLANDTHISVTDGEGVEQEWPLSFDLIASLKALYTLLSGAESSGAMRQGAVRMTDEHGREIIVGCSGLNSAIDEMVARNIARDVLADAAASSKQAA